MVGPVFGGKKSVLAWFVIVTLFVSSNFRLSGVSADYLRFVKNKINESKKSENHLLLIFLI